MMRLLLFFGFFVGLVLVEKRLRAQENPSQGDFKKDSLNIEPNKDHKITLSNPTKNKKNERESRKENFESRFALDTVDFDAQDSLKVVRIFLECHHKTKDRIILRELAIAEGDKIHRADLEAILEREKNKIFNTNLFINVAIHWWEVAENEIEISISLTEQWYLFPMPLIELSDRNFNVWWQQFRWDLSRIDWGLRFRQRNFRGRNEDLLLHFQLGFTHKFELAYQVPYINKKQTVGLRFHLGYTENNTVAYNTIGDNWVFVGKPAGEILQRRFYVVGQAQIRSRFFDRHSFGLAYRASSVADTIATLNANFFGEGQKQQRFLELSYQFARDRRDRVAYPLKGYLVVLQAQKLGLGVFNEVDIFNVKTEFSHFLPVTKNINLSNSIFTKLSFPNESQPYTLLRGFGLNKEAVRGFEQFVVESQQYFVSKNTLRYKLFDKVLTFWERLPSQFNKMPIALYPKAFFDIGYAQNTEPMPFNTLHNRWLWGAGLGFDVVTYYNMVFRWEYSFTNTGVRGANFAFKAEF
jgi:outer membrane protein assembly factor BamA